MVSGYFAYQLQTNEMADRLVVGGGKKKNGNFSSLGVQEGPTTSTFQTVTQGIKCGYILTCITPTCKIFLHGKQL
jgi:hypothetical protein